MGPAAPIIRGSVYRRGLGSRAFQACGDTVQKGTTSQVQVMSPVRAGPHQRLRAQRVDLVPGGGRGSYQKAGVRTPAKQAVGESLLHVQNRGQKTKRESGRVAEEKAGA